MGMTAVEEAVGLAPWGVPVAWGCARPLVCLAAKARFVGLMAVEGSVVPVTRGRPVIPQGSVRPPPLEEAVVP